MISQDREKIRNIFYDGKKCGNREGRFCRDTGDVVWLSDFSDNHHWLERAWREDKKSCQS